MADEAAQTPYAEAVALRDAGHSSEAIAVRLRGRGLDAEAVALLLNAVGVRAIEIPLPRVIAADEALVASAPMVPSSASCPRCGVFFQADTWELVLGKAYCRTCAARPEVNYPRAYRDQHWARRDGWAWFFGFSSLLSLLAGAFTLIRDPLLASTLILSGVGYLLFWAGTRVGRPALVAVTGVGLVLSVAQRQPPNIVALLFVVTAMRSARTRLFFEIEVPEAELAAAWMAQHDNRPAQFARALGLIALGTIITWPGSHQFAIGTVALGLPALVLGVIGLRRVKPDATPPVGRKSAAITGLVSGALALLAGAIYLVISYGGARAG